MLKGHDIIYVAGHDYNLVDSRISTDHIAEQLSRDNRMLYVESVGLRRPRLDKNDLSRIGRKLARFLRPPRRVTPNLWVLTPLAIPLHDKRSVRRLNQWLMVAQIRLAEVWLRFRRPILIIFLPHMVGLVGRLGEAISVYYCTDEHAAFPGVDAATIRSAEEELLRKVHLVFATSTEIQRNKSRVRSDVLYSPHGVDFSNFARASDPSLPVPTELRGLQHPIVGYFGAVDRWLDTALIAQLAAMRPRWSFVFIGKVVVDVSELTRFPNVLFLGQRPFEDLPRYGRLFDVAVIPFQVNELTASVSPIKLKEYLAMGKPVVSSPLPAVVDFAKRSDLVRIADNADAYLTQIEQLLEADNPERQCARRNLIRDETWEARVKAIGASIEEGLRGRGD